MGVSGSFIPFYKKIPYAQKAQNAHKRIKTNAVLIAHKKHVRGRKSLVWRKKHKTHISE